MNNREQIILVFFLLASSFSIGQNNEFYFSHILYSKFLLYVTFYPLKTSHQLSFNANSFDLKRFGLIIFET
jgi:hypothetical protein